MQFKDSYPSRFMPRNWLEWRLFNRSLDEQEADGDEVVPSHELERGLKWAKRSGGRGFKIRRMIPKAGPKRGALGGRFSRLDKPIKPVIRRMIRDYNTAKPRPIRATGPAKRRIHFTFE